MKDFSKLLLLALVAVLASCGNTSNKILYLQDIAVSQAEQLNLQDIDIKLQPQDKVAIYVTTKDPRLSALFNLPRLQYRIGAGETGGTLDGGNSETSCYTLDENGEIDFPIIGKINLRGYSKTAAAQVIKKKLLESDLVNDVVVTVEYMNLYFSVLGEVAKPGRYPIGKERISLLEALSIAGDLTIYGKRENILVVREQNGQRETYTVDLRSKDIFHSPVYYLQQNDIVYVQPNKVRAGQSTLNENSFKSMSGWLSISSLLMTLAVLLFK